jgi:hypothetical protein
VSAPDRALSLILCSRNDRYMGNSLWRLTTALDYVADRVDALGRLDDVEVLVADWGSDTPLSQVLRLGPAAARLVSFVEIPPALAVPLQRDSPFPEVLALNAAARRARGRYIGRIDQDTLVGRRSLEVFFELYEGSRRLDVPLDAAVFFSQRRDVPYRFAVRCPPEWAVARLVAAWASWFPVEGGRRPPRVYATSVGIWLVPRDLWFACGGYDERMIYMNAMETDMASRLLRRYPLVDLGPLTGYDFYHLEHFHPLVPRKSSTYRKTNRDIATDPDAFRANGDDWGLLHHPVAMAAYPRAGTPSPDAGRWSRGPGFLWLLAVLGVQLIADRLVLWLRDARRRGGVAWRTVRGRPVRTWGPMLFALWRDRRHRV